MNSNNSVPMRKRTVFLLLLIMMTCAVSACKGAEIDIHVREETAPEEEAVVPVSGHRIPEDKGKDFYTDYKLGTYTEILLRDNGSEVIPNDAEGVEITKNVVKISKEGTYVLSGKLSDGMIWVSSLKESDVRLVLNGVTLTGKKAAPLYIECADKCILSLLPGTVNVITDIAQGEVEGEVLTAAVYSREDLVINGSGTLKVNAGAEDGITSKDTLKIMEGVVEVTAADDGLYGKDELVIRGGSITVNAGGGAGARESSPHGWFSDEDEETPENGQALRSAGFIEIDGGEVHMDSYGDGLHSDGDVFITGGKLLIRTSDDGMHARNYFQMEGGEAAVEESMEGVEASEILVNNGFLWVTALNDGLNASFGKAASEEGSEGEETEQRPEKEAVTISGGTVYLSTVEDAIDSNGDLSLLGGTLIVDGPSSEKGLLFRVAGKAVLSGTSVLAAGEFGLTGDLFRGEKQHILLTEIPGGASGDRIKVTDADGVVLVTISAGGAYQSLFVSLPELKSGITYSILVNGQSAAKLTVSDD